MKIKVSSLFSPVNLLLLTIFALAFFVRIYRVNSLLGFWYDQGRDALVIWDFLHQGKLFLVGPTTGIEGIFRGPWYYWLITPFYFLGKGDPVWPAVFLSATTILALFLLYKLGQEIGGRAVGIFSVIIASFSFYLVSASRWLSNPTPMFLVSMLFVYSLFSLLKGKSWGWVSAFFMGGIAMQFGSATELFYFLGIGGVALHLYCVDRKKLPDIKTLALSISALLIPFTPQILFDYRHQGILRAALAKYLFQEAGSEMTLLEIIKIRLPLYYDMIFSKFFPSTSIIKAVFAAGIGLLVIFNFKKIIRNKKLLVVGILAVSPLVGMLFLHRNWGSVYDYYFTGYYLIYILFIVSVLGFVLKSFWGRVFLIIFLFLFLKDNVPGIKGLITSGLDGPAVIALGNQKQVVNWVYEDAKGENFNVDAYVPPVIPYAYDYLFLWQGSQRCGESLCGQEVNKQVDLLYTLYEVDIPRPERLAAWLARQAKIGRVVREARFGGIAVQRRQRL